MKYLSIAQIKESIGKLSEHHPFFGTTFLALKRKQAPVGSAVTMSLDNANRDLLAAYYRMHPKSAHFFVPFKRSSQYDIWVKPEYASKTLQRINTSTFAAALVHQRNGAEWGWAHDYVAHLRSRLPIGKKFPLFHLGVWIFRTEEWQDGETRDAVTQRIVREFHVSPDELDQLFDTSFSSGLSEASAFQALPVRPAQILDDFSHPPDVPPDNSGTLLALEVANVGPIRGETIRLNPGSRLNIITGDNGLGKTFLLDLVWWALTREWSDRPLIPIGHEAGEPRVSYLVANSSQSKPVTAEFDKIAFHWKLPRRLPALSGLVVYARVDGSFAVWDPANVARAGSLRPNENLSLVFHREEVWDGKDSQIEGLIRDWVRWQSQPNKYPAFSTFQKVLKRVSPPDLGELSIGEPVRLRGERREIPTLKHPYGAVPIIYESAGIRRIVTLAYLIVWAWEEHRIQAKDLGVKEERQMVIIVDEAEAHLHPKWQRVLLQALVGLAADLHEDLSIQFFIATHSPLVLASAEPLFDEATDKLFHLEMLPKGKVKFTEMKYSIQGSSDAWLTSDAFGLGFAGSTDSEKALTTAEALMASSSVTKAEVEAATTALSDSVAAENPVWMRWILFAAQHGVDV